MRFRLGGQYQNLGMVNDSGDEDAFDSIGGCTGLVVDHCTFSWSDDESFTCHKGDHTTLQWNLISEGLNYSCHFETGDSDFEHHGYGGIWGVGTPRFTTTCWPTCRAATRASTARARPGTAQTPLDVSQLAAGNYLLVYGAAPGAQRLSIKFLKAK